MEITRQGRQQSIRAALEALGLTDLDRAVIRVTTYNLPPGDNLTSVIKVLEENDIDYDTLRRLRGAGSKRSGNRPNGLYERVTATWRQDETVTSQEVADACELALIAARLEDHEVLAITTSRPDRGTQADILISRMTATGHIKKGVQTARFDERARRLVEQEKSPAETAAHQAALERKPPAGLFYIPTLAHVVWTIYGGRCTVHGFRSSFRDWASEQTSVPHAVAEAALAHQVGSDVERSYARSDLFEKRRGLMDRWAEFVTTPMC